MINTSVLANNEAWAKNARVFKDNGVYAVNLMSSPGPGKRLFSSKASSTLLPSLNVGVIVGDIATTEDAEDAGKGVPVVQINTHGACHLDARMISGCWMPLIWKT